MNVIVARGEELERGVLMLALRKKRAVLAANLVETAQSTTDAVALRRASELTTAQLENYRLYLAQQVARAREVIVAEDKDLQRTESLWKLREKLCRFLEFAAFESDGAVSCSRVEHPTKRSALLARWGIVESSLRCVQIADVFELGNSLWMQPKSPSTAAAAIRFARLPRSLVQRTVVHGLEGVSDSRLQEAFVPQSQVLRIISGKAAIPFPLTLWHSFDNATGMATDETNGSFHFVLVISDCSGNAPISSDSTPIIASSAVGLVPIGFVVFDFKAPIQQRISTTATLDKRLIRAIAKKEQEFIAWIACQTQL